MKRFSLFLLFALCALLSACGTTGVWSNAKEIQPGILLATIQKDTPRLMKIYALRVDLETPGLKFITNDRDPDYGKPMPDFPKHIIHTKRMKAKDFLMEVRDKRKMNAIVAINAAPWGPWCAPWNQKYAQLAGLNISDGVIISSERCYAKFIRYKDGTMAIADKVPETDYDKIDIALCGFGIVLKDGKYTTKDIPNAKPNPRTVYGLSKDRRYLYLVAIDGRQPDYSLGATDWDMSGIMTEIGAWDAMNMDGGGSTSLVLWDDAKKEAVFYNRHDPTHQVQRTLANCLVICLEPTK